MRPTDENQAGSRRPNLMSSSRRTGGEINILAMLDGKTPGMLSRRVLGLPRTFWYGVAAITVCLLVAALAWLARTPASSRSADRDEAMLQPPPPVPVPAPVPTVPDVPASPPRITPGAIIIDGAGASASPAQTTPPAMTPPLTSSQSLHDAAATTAPAHTHARSPKHPPAHAAVRATTGERKPATPHPGASHADAPARTKRPTGTTKPTPPAALDTDVALISAIIQHTNAHPDPADAENDAAPPCTKPGCHARLPNRQ